MKRIFATLLAAAMLLCGIAAAAEAVETVDGTQINTLIESGSFIIQIDVKDGDMGWYADEMAQDDSVVKLYVADILDDTFVARYDAVGDGEVTVGVRHFYTGFACDEAYTWDLLVKDGAVQEVTGGSHTAISDEADIDPYLSGDWLEQETQFTVLTVEKNPARGWDVEIISPVSHGAYVFRTTVCQDCVSGGLIYDKGKFWNVPITDSEETELGEAALAGTTGCFLLGGTEEEPVLTWRDDVGQTEEIVFCRADSWTNEASVAIDYGASQIYTQADMDEAIALIEEEFATWEGCELHSIRYASDDCNSAENLAWLNELEEGRDYAECICFLSDFHSPVEAYGAWEADTEYEDYEWWLARAQGGNWELVSFGY